MKNRLLEKRKILKIKAFRRSFKEFSALKKVHLARFRSSSVVITQGLKEANKYIFIQNFEAAAKILKALSLNFKENYEVQFRRVEVACKMESLNDLTLEFKLRAEAAPRCFALYCAHLLCSIHTRDAERAKDLLQELEQLPMASGADYTRFPLVRGSEKTVHVARHLHVVDDFIPPSGPVKLPESSADLFANESINLSKNSAIKLTESQAAELHTHPLLAHALELGNSYPKNYAAWFVAGCALESLEHISQAIDSWNKAFEINPKSTAVLSHLSELQQIGVISNNGTNYIQEFEKLDAHLVHGNLKTHTELYAEFLLRGETKNAIGALRSLADWMQKQQGHVPPEVEILCFLGAMQAYRLEKNFAASEACRREAEFLTLAVKKNHQDMEQLFYIAEICEEFELVSIARSCLLTVIASPLTPLPLLLKSIEKCLNDSCSESLKDHLKIAYKNTHGHGEIRYFILICNLKLMGIDVERYLIRKEILRDKISKNNLEESFPLLKEAFAECPEDAEINYYLGEYFSLQKDDHKAHYHFRKMYEIDSLNPDSLIRYCFFLLRLHKYSEADDLAQEALAISSLTPSQSAELHWSSAAALFSQNQFDMAKEKIDKALESDTWNTSYLALSLRLATHLYQELGCYVPRKLLESIENHIILHENSELPNQNLLGRLDLSVSDLIKKGFGEQAWYLSKCRLIISGHMDDETLTILARAGAAFNPRLAAKELLLLLQNTTIKIKETSLNKIATCIALLHSFSNEWALVDEWLDVALKGINVKENVGSPKLFELEALKLAVHGADYQKAQTLIEAAMDFYSNAGSVPVEMQVLHGYLLLAQGNINVGIEKIQNNISENSSIQSLYFLIKGLDRAGKLTKSNKESITKLFSLCPTNLLEQKFIEEIFFTVGKNTSRFPTHLIC